MSSLTIHSRIEFEAVAWEWLRAEVFSARFGALYKQIPPKIVEAIGQNRPENLTNEAKSRLLQLLFHVRGPLIRGATASGVNWFVASLPQTQLGDLYAINCRPFTEIASSRRLAAIAKKMDKCEPSFRKLLGPIEAPSESGMPILVTNTNLARIHILEGHVRLLAEYLSKALKPTIPVVVGVASEIAKWCLFEDSKPTNILLFPDYDGETRNLPGRG